MKKSAQLWTVAVLLAFADLAVFTHCIPIICQAWGSNIWLMSALFVGLFVWTRSLASLLRITIFHSFRHRKANAAGSVPLPLPPACHEKE